jgi:hypothetical protein
MTLPDPARAIRAAIHSSTIAEAFVSPWFVEARHRDAWGRRA